MRSGAQSALTQHCARKKGGAKTERDHVIIGEQRALRTADMTVESGEEEDPGCCCYCAQVKGCVNPACGGKTWPEFVDINGVN